jgi:hypothetical protein
MPENVVMQPAEEGLIVARKTIAEGFPTDGQISPRTWTDAGRQYMTWVRAAEQVLVRRHGSSRPLGLQGAGAGKR